MKTPKNLFLLLTILWGCQNEKTSSSSHNLRIFDDRLEVKLMMEDPDIVTPIGIAVDDKDRVYVLESHTHLPPKDYEGPGHDIIKVFEDTNGDGTWDRQSVFADGLQEGLNLAFSPEGHLYAVTSREVWKFYDEDGDGISERKEKLMELVKPSQVYAHAALLSITFDTDGWMYIGRGNTGGEHWIFRGADGSEVSGYGDGGNIMRARWDGTGLEEFSTGFWNPFDLKFDNYGRLLVADNDPDSRGPNRLVHAVMGADFGYKSLFGGSGIHQYLAWEGELPGTLPIAVPLGEAPSGLLNANLGNLPDDYEGEMLCTIWEESRIVRIKMKDEGWSVRGNTEIILEGGADFRPVAFATDSKGNIFFTDWVIRYYPNHGRGKIWKLNAKSSTPTLKRRTHYEPVMEHPEVQNLDKALAGEKGFKEYEDLLASEDPFQYHAGVIGLAQERYLSNLESLLNHQDADKRLGAVLALMRIGHPRQEQLAANLLLDDHMDIVRMTMIWMGREGMTRLQPQLISLLGETTLPHTLFETYLETIKLLQPEFITAYKAKDFQTSKNLPRVLPDGFLENIVRSDTYSASVRAIALRHLPDPENHKELLSSLVKESAPELQLEALRSLSNVRDPEIAGLLTGTALEPQYPSVLRSEALLALERQTVDDYDRITPLLKSQDPNISIEAARLLRGKASRESVKDALVEVLEDGNACDDEALRQQLMLSLHGEAGERPGVEQLDQWQELLSEKGDPVRGRRVFFSTGALCSSCHTVEGRGGDLGPDLSNVGRSKDRKGLISSILLPSQEISPEWQGWYIRTADGKTHTGRQIDVGNDNIELYTETKGFISIDKSEIEDYGIQESSLMPEGLEARLTNHDLMDLITYLESL